MPDHNETPEETERRFRETMDHGIGIPSESEHLEEEARRLIAKGRLEEAERAAREPTRPTVTTLCGSTRFPEAHWLAQMHLSLVGRIVIPCGLYGHADEPRGAQHATRDGDENSPAKQRLDALHYRKIDVSDGIYVVNVGLYVGSSTKLEIQYALDNGKTVEYMFDHAEIF